MPTQALLVFTTGPDEILAVIEQELQLQRRLVQMRGRQGLGALSERCSGDGEGVDRVGLTAGALAAAGFAHELGRNSDDVLTGGDQKALEGT